MNELIITKDNLVDLAYQDDQLKEYTSSIKDLINGVSRNYIFVGFWLCKAKKLDLKSLGYENIEDYANKVFNISRSTTFNMIAIAEKFCRWDGWYENYPTLKDEFKGFNYTQLIELLTLDEVDVNRFKNKTVAQIQELKVIDKVQEFIDTDIESDLEWLKEKVVKSLSRIAVLLDDFKTKDDPVFRDNLRDYLKKEKCKENKLSYNITPTSMEVSKSYDFSYKNDNDLKFKLNYHVSYQKENIVKTVWISFPVNNWQLSEYIKNEDKSQLNLDLHSVDAIVNDKLLVKFTIFYKSYFEAKGKLARKNDNSDIDEINESLKIITSMGDVSIKDIKNQVAYKKHLKGLFDNSKNRLDINDKETLFFITGTYYGTYVYLKLDEDLYFKPNYDGNLIVYKKEVKNDNTYFSQINDPLIKERNNMVIAFYKNNINLLKGENKK